MRECVTTLLLTVFTQRNFAADFLREKYIFRGKKWSICIFGSPLGLRGNVYAVHHRVIGKPIDCGPPISDYRHFLLGVRAEALRVNIDWKYPFFEAGEGVSLAQNFR